MRIRFKNTEHNERKEPIEKGQETNYLLKRTEHCKR